MRDYPHPLEYFPNRELAEPIAENGHAAAAIAITASIIEAYLRRAVLAGEGSAAAGGEKVFEALRKIALNVDANEVDDLINRIRELFLVRNALVHSHVWLLERGRWKLDESTGSGERVIANRVVGGRGNQVDDRLPLTGLNIVPTWVDLNDVLIGLKLTVEVLDVLDRAGVGSTTVVVPFLGRPQSLANAVQAFEKVVQARPDEVGR